MISYNSHSFLHFSKFFLNFSPLNGQFQMICFWVHRLFYLIKSGIDTEFLNLSFQLQDLLSSLWFLSLKLILITFCFPEFFAVCFCSSLNFLRTILLNFFVWQFVGLHFFGISYWKIVYCWWCHVSLGVCVLQPCTDVCIFGAVTSSRHFTEWFWWVRPLPVGRYKGPGWLKWCSFGLW